MKPLRRELLWIGIVAMQIASIGLVTPAGSLLLRIDWLHDLFRIPDEAVLVPFFVALGLVLPACVAVAFIEGVQAMKAGRRGSARVGPALHLFAAYLGALIFHASLSLSAGGGLRAILTASLVAIPPAALLAGLLYWPRLAFPALRPDVTTPASPRS